MVQLILISYILLVIFLSLIPTAALVSGMPSDKLAHFLAYGVMGGLAYLSVESKAKKAYLFIIIISLGAVLEVLQFFIPGRSTSFFDMIANTLGAAMGYITIWLVMSVVLNKLNLEQNLGANTKESGFRNNLGKAP